MKETSKAMRRRWEEETFPWKQIFTGNGIDVGVGDDPILGLYCTPFDKRDGDANRLSSYFPANHFDWLHSSQSLEHMLNPHLSIRDWIKVVKPGGHLICTVPSWELYEGMVWPSRWNSDHKSTFSLWQKGSPAKIHVYVPEFLEELGLKVNLCRLVDTNYDYSVGTRIDQTFKFGNGVEAFIEFVIQK